MGIANFATTATGKTMKEAFNKAVEQAQHEHGHGGYTGTIAEKSSVIDLTAKSPAKTRKTKIRWAWEMTNLETGPVYDKWGPCGAVKLGLVRTTRYAPTVKKYVPCYETEWCFFGNASE